MGIGSFWGNKMKRYRNFAFPRVAVGLFIGILLFELTYSVFNVRYNSSIASGVFGLSEQYEKILASYDRGEITSEFIGMLSHFYRADYLRLSKIDEVGNISTIYETDYNTIAVENGIHDWIYVTDNENLVGSMYNYKQPGKNGFELTIRYLKCDEAAEVAGSTDVYFANSYDLLSWSDGWYSNGADPFYVTGELIGIFYYPYYSVETYYTDDEYLHMGLVTEDLSPKLFDKKIWDFTVAENADLYLVSESHEVVQPLTITIGSVRPDKVLEQESDVFGKMSLAKLYKSGKFTDSESYYCEYDAEGGCKTYGYVEIYEVGKDRYLIEQIITAKPFAEQFMPFLVFYGVFLLLVCIGLPLLFAIRPYLQYKKAYENNQFKNNLIDALAHNLKTPLMILGGYAENLKDVEGDTKNRYADEILAKTAEMNRDIESILQTAGKTTPVLARTSIRELVEQVVKTVGADAEIEGNATFWVDREYFAQALTCLIDNASKYKSECPVTIKISSGEIVIRNKTGSDRFTAGTGLAIAGRIIEQHKLKLRTGVKDGEFEARISRK